RHRRVRPRRTRAPVSRAPLQQPQERPASSRKRLGRAETKTDTPKSTVRPFEAGGTCRSLYSFRGGAQRVASGSEIGMKRGDVKRRCCQAPKVPPHEVSPEAGIVPSFNGCSTAKASLPQR